MCDTVTWTLLVNYVRKVPESLEWNAFHPKDALSAHHPILSYNTHNCLRVLSLGQGVVIPFGMDRQAYTEALPGEINKLIPFHHGQLLSFHVYEYLDNNQSQYFFVCIYILSVISVDLLSVTGI